MKKIMFDDKYGLTKAVLEGKKTQTRRVISDKILDKIKLFQDEYLNASCDFLEGKDLIEAYMVNYPEKLPYNVGEIVAVAQKYSDCGGVLENGIPRWKYISKIVGNTSGGWANKMFVKPELMPHQIRITAVRVERLQDISKEDCLSEGVGISKTDNRIGYPFAIPFNYYIKEDIKGNRYTTPREAYAALIDKISGKGTWESNPYVFVYDFELIK